MSNYQAGDRVNVYVSANVATAAEYGQLVNDGAPRAATIEREHEGDVEVTYDDDGSSEFVSNSQRFRPLLAKK
jgi:hypothetical protein